MYKKAQFFHYSKQKIFHVKKNNSSQRTLQNSKSITCQSQNIINTDIKLKRKKNLCFCPRRQTDITMQNFVRKCTYLEKIKKKLWINEAWVCQNCWKRKTSIKEKHHSQNPKKCILRNLWLILFLDITVNFKIKREKKNCWD